MYYNIVSELKLANDALLVCDTIEAKRHFVTAASYLSDLAEHVSNKDEILLFCAETYIDGGEWKAALKILKSIPPYNNKLTHEQNKLHISWLNMAIERDMHGNTKSLSLLERAIVKSDWSLVIELLKNDPYLVLPTELAKIRENACTALKNIEAAKMFEQDAYNLHMKYSAKKKKKRLPPKKLPLRGLNWLSGG
jgi:tetratricopeptide (TPR) repeat protein